MFFTPNTYEKYHCHDAKDKDRAHQQQDENQLRQIFSHKN
jgi:hypothetical protein